ncbi:MAG: DUF4430 domain-containing protein [Defluviitaleaceae bacterium]|nr:DUF4430 domain-containing protein [Defluviitaleaceae bacterium]
MKKVRFFVLALTLLAAFFYGALQVRAESEPMIRVYITFEGYNLGHGFYVVLLETDVPAGTNVLDFTTDTLREWGYEYDLTPWGGLDRIHGIYLDREPNPPPYITVELGAGAGDGSLGSFDYTEYSGWIFTVNHVMADVGASDYILQDGDVVRWQFSIEGWGADLGLGEDRGFWTDPLYEHADKTEMIRALFTSGLDEYFQDVMLSFIIDPHTTDEMVEDVLSYLPEFIIDPFTITMPVWENPFTDVDEDDWFFVPVWFMHIIGLMVGVEEDRFDPHTEFTRAMAVTVAWRLEGRPVTESGHVFKDVPERRWFSNAAVWAVAIGIIEAGEYFDPQRPVTDVEFLGMLGFDVAWEDSDVLTRAEAAEMIYSLMVAW